VTEVNETDFLPWILGGSVLVASIIAIVIASSARTTSSPAVLAARSAAPKSDVQAAALPAIAVQATSQQALPPGRVWECAVNGQRTFSDSPCGTTSTNSSSPFGDVLQSTKSQLRAQLHRPALR
jgi:hypothetical protein